MKKLFFILFSLITISCFSQSNTYHGTNSGIGDAGNHNSFYGGNSGWGNTGTYVTAIGFGAGYSNTKSNVIYIGGVDSTKGLYVNLNTGVARVNGSVLGTTGSSTVKIVKKTIGAFGVAGCDFNFTNLAKDTLQSVDLGTLLPVLARPLDVAVVTNQTFTGAVSLGVEIGVGPSAPDAFLTSANMYTVTTTNSSNPVGTFNSVFGISTSTWDIYITATPGAAWNLISAGKITVYVTYIDYGSM